MRFGRARRIERALLRDWCASQAIGPSSFPQIMNAAVTMIPAIRGCMGAFTVW
jgi:hypothetical protein